MYCVVISKLSGVNMLRHIIYDIPPEEDMLSLIHISEPTRP